MAYVAPTTANAVAGSAILASDMLVVMNDVIAIATRPYLSVTSTSSQTSVGAGTSLTGMTGTSTFTGAPVLVKWGASVSGPAVGNWITFSVFLDGVAVGYNHGLYLPTSAANAYASDFCIVTPSAGSHTITVKCVSASVSTWVTDMRQMVYFEIGSMV